MKITREQAVRVFKILESLPRKHADLIGQFEQMAQGSRGPHVPGAVRPIHVRDHYYPTWPDEDFQWVLDHLTG